MKSLLIEVLVWVIVGMLAMALGMAIAILNYAMR